MPTSPYFHVFDHSLLKSKILSVPKSSRWPINLLFKIVNHLAPNYYSFRGKWIKKHGFSIAYRHCVVHFIEFSKLKDLITWMCDAISHFPSNSIQEMRKRTLLLLLQKQFIVRGDILSSLNKNYFTSSIISPYFNTPLLHKIIIKVKIKVFSETPFIQFSHNLSLEVVKNFSVSVL